MKQIRQSVFETNSSSTHSLTICTKEDFSKLCSNKAFLNTGWGTPWTDYPKVIDVNQLREIANKLKASYPDRYSDDFDSMSEADIVDYFGYDGTEDIKLYDKIGEELEYFEEEFTTPGGETVVVFGEFGYDG